MDFGVIQLPNQVRTTGLHQFGQANLVLNYSEEKHARLAVQLASNLASYIKKNRKPNKRRGKDGGLGPDSTPRVT